MLSHVLYRSSLIICLHLNCSPSTFQGTDLQRDKSRGSDSIVGKMEQTWSICIILKNHLGGKYSLQWFFTLSYWLCVGYCCNILHRARQCSNWLLIIFQHQSTNLQYSWLCVDEPIRFWLNVVPTSLDISMHKKMIHM